MPSPDVNLPLGFDDITDNVNAAVSTVSGHLVPALIAGLILGPLGIAVGLLIGAASFMDFSGAF